MTMECALSHWSLPAHHSAASAGARSAGGFVFVSQRRNSESVIADDRRTVLFVEAICPLRICGVRFETAAAVCELGRLRRDLFRFMSVLKREWNIAKTTITQ